MFGKSRSAFALLLLVALGAPHPSWAVAPANDNWANRKPVVFTSGTFSDSNVALSQATHEATDPDPPCRLNFGGDPTVNPEVNDVWYGYTTGASTEYWTLAIGTGDSNLAGVITVYTGTPGNFTIISGGCGAINPNLFSTKIAGLRLAPNTAYSIKVGATQSPISLALNFTISQAMQYVVTKTDDTKDGACNVGDCSLRDAIIASNSNPGAVLVPAGTYTLSLGAGIKNFTDNSAGNLSVNYGMGIYGAGLGQTVIDANQIDRVMKLDGYNQGYQTFILGDLTLQNGNSVIELSAAQPGGGLLIGLLSSSNYFGLERVALLSNVSNLAGAGIYAVSPGTIRDSIISSNTGNGNNFGGGGIYYQGDKSKFLEITGSTISGNSTQGSGNGGGVYGWGTLRMTNSTISENQAGNAGGGIYSIKGALLMANDTVVNNGAGSYATGTFGGGVHLDGGAGNGSTVISNSIIAYNTLSAEKNAGEAPDCAIGDAPDSVVTSYNIVQAPNNCSFNGTGDMTGVDPQVSPTLAANGGLTPTHALIWGGPAIDAGDPDGCKDTFGALLLTDQRGVSRPDETRCDIGAFEYHNKIFQDGFEPAN